MNETISLSLAACPYCAGAVTTSDHIRFWCSTCEKDMPAESLLQRRYGGGRRRDATLDLDLSDFGDITYRQLDHWTRKGWLKPAERDRQSQGVWREWPSSEKRIAQLMARLVRGGLTPEAAHRVARAGGSCEIAPGIRVTVAPL